ncbi:hypothetical protein [Teredinibacter sp. KSP-S5-2]|uniref:hypothetical protein n=1 Tax=Teredinibacter sp. KSP-S5-2 TaxID=3034506 RepID=UPI00293475F4|nr:hypothetical protein [Teredinibacter sp. KSP-S5-2]WNO10524.1 hypothetical protein P5V12_04995 [Teredinibacter sp. KSP-S5-2]
MYPQTRKTKLQKGITMSDDKASTEELKEQLGHYLNGYGRSQPQRLKDLTSITNWNKLAEQELQRRATQIIQNLDEQMLNAIAEGKIQLNQEIEIAFQRLTK